MKRTHTMTTSLDAAQARRLSNIGHWAEGALFGALGILALLQALDLLTGAARFVPATVLLLAGAFLPAFLFGHSHGTPGHARVLLKDPQQRQHLAMAGLLLAAGGAELAVVLGAPTGLGYVWPAVLAVIGVMFTLHTQHGDHAAMAKAIRFHRVLGATIILAGMARAAATATG